MTYTEPSSVQVYTLHDMLAKHFPKLWYCACCIIMRCPSAKSTRFNRGAAHTETIHQQLDTWNRQLTLCQSRRRVSEKKPQQRQNAAVSAAAPHRTPAGHRIFSAKQRMKSCDLRSIPTRSFTPSGTAIQSLYCRLDAQQETTGRCYLIRYSALSTEPRPEQNRRWDILQIRLHTIHNTTIILYSYYNTRIKL